MSQVTDPSGIDSPPLTKAERKKMKRKHKKDKKKQDRFVDNPPLSQGSNSSSPYQNTAFMSNNEYLDPRGQMSRNQRRHAVQHQNRKMGPSGIHSRQGSTNAAREDDVSPSSHSSPHQRVVALKHEVMNPTAPKAAVLDPRIDRRQARPQTQPPVPEPVNQTRPKPRDTYGGSNQPLRSLFSNLLPKLDGRQNRTKSPERLFDDAQESFDQYTTIIGRVDNDDQKKPPVVARYMPIDQERVLVTDYGRIRHRLNSYTKNSEDSASASFSEDEEHSDELHMLLSASKGRYYATTHEEYEKCYNCQEYGHISKNCPNRSVIKCFFCLGNHKKETCEIANCFCCSQEGHRSSNCPFRTLPSCRRCFKRGHKERECRALINFRETDQRTPEHLSVSSNQLLCLSCGKAGHLQCYLKGNEITSLLLKDGLYERQNMTVNSIQLDIPSGLTQDDLKDVNSGMTMSATQKKRRLNELLPEEAEEMTLEQFKKYKQMEEEYEEELLEEAIGKRPPRSNRRSANHPLNGPRIHGDWTPLPNWKQKRAQKRGR